MPKKNIRVWVAVLVLLISWICGGCGLPDAPVGEGRKESGSYWLAAHYFADVWPKNLWDSEFEGIASEFQKIKDDGFNCVVIIVPWREFQPDTENGATYNEAAFGKLDMIISEAAEKQLGVVIRLGYFWDYYKNESMEGLYDRYWDLARFDDVRAAWLDYSRKVYTEASRHDNFWGGFICWEDFWGNVDRVREISGKNEASYEAASYLGYEAYMKDVYSNEELSGIFHEQVNNYSKLYIPSARTPEFATFYDFYDQWLNGLLEDTQGVFPGLSMEVRIDNDPVAGSGGEYYSHKATYPCGGAGYTTIVYGIPVGFENKGERVHWEEALAMTASVLNGVCQGSDYKKLFIDQFLFYDNTQAFSHNAQIIREEIGDYLANCPDVLLDYSMGYGIWTYKDYYFDAIANGEFAKGLDGWDAGGGAEIRTVDGSNKCFLGSGQFIEQDTEGKVETVSETITCSFEARPAGGSAKLIITMDGEEQQIIINEDGKYTAEFSNADWGKLRITAESEIYLDNIKLYNYCQEGLLYDTDGNSDAYIGDIREMNFAIQNRVSGQDGNWVFYDMIREFGDAELDNAVASEDYLIGWNIGTAVGADNARQIFMAPGTAAGYSLELDSHKRVFHMEYMLQEDAASWGLSDGVDLTVEVLDPDGNVLEKVEAERVKPNGEAGSLDVELHDYSGKTIFLKIVCSENAENTCDADWVILRSAYVD